ncbi:hypothetical protein TNCV_4755601 [Trichonephila clavipes]|nr:hypothetical protein TNCV_4755601 [Trichonephila clavipes]
MFQRLNACGGKFNTGTGWYRSTLNYKPKITSIENNRHAHGAHWRHTRGTLISHRAASPFVRLGEAEDRWEAPDPLAGVLPQNWGKGSS